MPAKKKTMSQYAYYKRVHKYIKEQDFGVYPYTWKEAKKTIESDKDMVLYSLETDREVNTWFQWNDTPQGFHFWERVYRNVFN